MDEPNQLLDLKGVFCPMNYLKTKSILEHMEDGEVLEVLLDDNDESILNVPKKVKKEGHLILKIESINGQYRVLIKKRNET
jgi:tRNA 2-thiouridine synthesizing protein A